MDPIAWEWLGGAASASISIAAVGWALLERRRRLASPPLDVFEEWLNHAKAKPKPPPTKEDLVPQEDDLVVQYEVIS